MSNIYRTAEVERLITPRDERIAQAMKVFEDAHTVIGDDPSPEEILAGVVQEIALLIERVERRCYTQMWDEANDIPQFDPNLEPKDCFHCKRMVKLRGELCYGHLKLYEEEVPEKETWEQVRARIGDRMCVRTSSCAEGRPHAPHDCPVKEIQ